MCRLLGIAANESTEFKIVLREAPRSLAALSRDHRDGWGIGVFDAQAGTWHVDKGAACAGEDERFHRLAVSSRGHLLLAHIRQKTIGDTSLANTHPFERGGWVFAHNGTIKEVAWLRANTSPERLAEIQGETDSELLFAWILTHLDETGRTGGGASVETDRAIGVAARKARDRADFGAFNFLLSDGSTTYAHRHGRSMFLLERAPSDAVVPCRTSRDGTIVETPWSAHRTAIFIASERVTEDEPWQSVEDGALLRIERVPTPHWRLIAA